MKHSTKIGIDVHESVEPCSFWRRLLVMLYDGLAIVTILILAALLPMLLGFGNQRAGEDVLYSLYLALVWFFYLAWNWHRGGMTLGMRAWRVRIVTESGSLPGWGQSLVRFLMSLVSAACFGLGFIWSVFEPQKRTWHDRVSETRLIRHRQNKRSD